MGPFELLHKVVETFENLKFKAMSSNIFESPLAQGRGLKPD